MDFVTTTTQPGSSLHVVPLRTTFTTLPTSPSGHPSADYIAAAVLTALVLVFVAVVAARFILGRRA